MAVIDKVWPRGKHFSTHGKMRSCLYNPDTKVLMVEVIVTLQTITPSIDDPLSVPHLARCPAREAQQRLAKTIVNQERWVYRLETICDPLVGDRATAHRGLWDKVEEDYNGEVRTQTIMNTSLQMMLRKHVETYFRPAQDAPEEQDQGFKKFIDNVDEFNFGGPEIHECAICWLVHPINACQAWRCGHLACRDCFYQLETPDGYPDG